jgi:tetratricopeptide (TPR) repeat protein
MFKRLGIENRFDGFIFLSLILLVAITPLGNEATHPIVLGLYRTLLFVILIASAIRMRHHDLPQVCYLFLGAAAIVFTGMYASVVFRSGSHFEGIYVFYQNALFFAAFVSLASFHRTRNSSWKNAILGLVVVICLLHLAVALVLNRTSVPGPLVGTFVNQNYFASYLLVGFSVCVAGAFYAGLLSVRIIAAGAGLVLLVGIGKTASRGAFLSLLALMAVAVLRTTKRHRIAFWRIVAVGILLVIITAVANPSLVQKFSDRGEINPYNYERVQIWMKALSMITSYPVTGVGPGGFIYVSKLFTPAVDGTIGRYEKWANIAHSEYLQYLAELGIPIALLMFTVGGYLFYLAWKRAETTAPESRIAQEAALLAAVGLGTHALVDNNWTVPVVAAGMAVISLADLLPYRSWPQQIEWTPIRKTALVLFTVAVFVQAVTIPFLGLFFNELGHQAYTAGNLKRAEEMHRLGLGFVPDHPVMLDNLGTVYLDMFGKSRKTEYLDLAEMRFTDSLAANPSLDRSAGHLENVYFQRLTGKVTLDKPIHTLIVSTERLRIQHTPFNPFIRKNLAEALYNLGEKQQAIEELQKAVELEPNYVPGYQQLGRWMDEAGRSTEASEYRKKADDIVMRYKDHATDTIEDAYDAILLGRPFSTTGQP